MISQRSSFKKGDRVSFSSQWKAASQLAKMGEEYRLVAVLMNLISKNKEFLRVVLAVCMLVAGSLHFIAPEPFIRIVPDVFPYHRALVYFTGVCEIGSCFGLLIPPLSRLTAWCLVALFIAVFPANLNMAIHHINIENIPDSPWFQAVRLPFQGVLIAWAWWYTRHDDRREQASILPGYPQSEI